MIELDPDEIYKMIMAIDFHLPTDRETIIHELATIIRLSKLDIINFDMEIFQDIILLSVLLIIHTIEYGMKKKRN